MKFNKFIPSSVDRPLTDEERRLQLNQKYRRNIPLFDQLSTVRINSTYLEAVDVYHNWKGVLAGIGLFLLILVGYNFIWGMCFEISDILKGEWAGPQVLIALLVTSIPFLLIGYFCFRVDSFRRTYEPIRFNRKNRMVYIMRRDGTVASAPWDEVYFSSWANLGRYQEDTKGLKCLILHQDRLTVHQMFLLNFQGDVKGIMNFWEYIRRYMEEGPKDSCEQVTYCIPIWNHFESPLYGYCRLMLNFEGVIFRILYSPLVLVFAIGRSLAMLTCWSPKWPEEVERACAIDPDDPYVRDWRNNPPVIPGIFSAIKIDNQVGEPKPPKEPEKKQEAPGNPPLRTAATPLTQLKQRGVHVSYRRKAQTKDDNS
jgi:hypothetical protein